MCSIHGRSSYGRKGERSHLVYGFKPQEFRKRWNTSWCSLSPAQLLRLSCLYKSTVINSPLLFFFCSSTRSCAEKKFVCFPKAYINFGILNPYSCTLEGWMHQIFSILTHCSAFKSCCLLQWDTGKALLLNLYYFFFSRVWLFFFSF